MDNNPVFSCVFCSFVFGIHEHVLIGYRQQMAAGTEIHASFQSGIDQFLINTHNEHLVYFLKHLQGSYCCILLIRRWCRIHFSNYLNFPTVGWRKDYALDDCVKKEHIKYEFKFVIYLCKNSVAVEIEFEFFCCYFVNFDLFSSKGKAVLVCFDSFCHP